MNVTKSFAFALFTEILVSLMLSSQTRDEVNHAACMRLRRAGLSPQMILDMEDDKLAELIKPVGFWRKKVVYLKKVAEILIRCACESCSWST